MAEVPLDLAPPVDPRNPALYAQPLKIIISGGGATSERLFYALDMPAKTVRLQAPLYPLGTLGIWLWTARRPPLDGFAIYRREQLAQPPYRELHYTFVGYAPAALRPNRHNSSLQRTVKDIESRIEKYHMSKSKKQDGVPLTVYLQDVRVLLAYLEAANAHILHLEAQAASGQTPVVDGLEAALTAQAVTSLDGAPLDGVPGESSS